MKIDKQHREKQALQIIANSYNSNKRPPTLRELKNKLGMTSDRGLMLLLDKLEKEKYISRNLDKKRGIQLLPSALALINPHKATTITGENTQTLSFTTQTYTFVMNERQKKLSEKLYDLDPKFSEMYKGALRILGDKINPDKIAQSAHSLREIFMIFANEQKKLLPEQELRESKKEKSTHKKVLQISFDPQTARAEELFGKSVYSEWVEIHNYFVDVAHHRIDVDEEEYINKVMQYEDFLLRYIFTHQDDIYSRIDNEIKKGPADIDLQELQRLITTNTASLTYFFSKLSSKWLQFLIKNNLLVPTIQSGEYLVRVASNKPNKVMDFIINYPKIDKPEEKFIQGFFINATINMPSSEASRIINKIQKEKWLEDPHGRFGYIYFDMKKLVKKLLDDKKYDDAQKLLTLLLGIRLKSKEERGYTSSHNITGLIEDHGYSEIISIIDDIPLSKLKPFIKILINKLEDAIKLVLAGEKEGDDPTYPWYSFMKENASLNHNDVNEQLIISIRDIIGKYLEYAKSKKINLIHVIDEFFNPDKKYIIFELLKMFFYRGYPTVFKEKIKWAIIDNFGKHELETEYKPLVRENFGIITQSFQDKYIDLILRGPEYEKKDKKYIRRWKIKQLAIIKEHLSAKHKKLYKELLQGEKEPSIEDEPMIRSFVGPTSPKTKDNLSALSVDEVIDYFIKWEPKNEFASPSRSGLGREFKMVVAEKAEYYSDNANKFNNDKLRPVYIYEYFSGLKDTIKNNKKINWTEVINLASCIIKKAKLNKLPIFENEKDDFNIDWGEVQQWMVNLIEDGMNVKGRLITFNLRKKIWDIIEFTCENEDPTLEHEKKYGGENSDLYHLSINTTRGVAFHALFAYIFWCDRNIENNAKKDSRVVPEVKPVLEKHLDIKHEPGLVIRAVYGRYFPWLYLYDKKWVTNLINEIFPLDDKELRYAAWETYLINGIFEEVYQKLKPQYSKAIDELQKKIPVKKYSINPTEGLAKHLMIAYTYGLCEMKDPLFQLFFKKATNEQKGMAISFVGRAYILSDNKDKSKIDFNRLKKLLTWRLKEATSTEELKEFGFWIKDGFFNNKWLLEVLIGILKKTNGLIESDFRIAEFLKSNAIKYPKLVADTLLLLVKARRKYRDFHLMREGEIKSILSELNKSDNASIKDISNKIIDHLMKLGHNPEELKLLMTKKEIQSSSKMVTKKAKKEAQT